MRIPSNNFFCRVQRIFLCLNIVCTLYAQMQTGRNTTTDDRLQFRLKGGLASLIALFFGLLLFLGQASPSTHVHIKVEGNLLHLPAAGPFLDITQPPDSPFESTPLPWEAHPTDKEGENTDNLDDEPDKIFSRVSLKRRIALAATKLELSQQSLSSANDERVPLFVLHHSWKTFVHEIPCFSNRILKHKLF